MRSLQNFTKTTVRMTGVIYLFLTSMLEEVLWQVLLIDSVKSSGFFWHNIPVQLKGYGV